MSEALKPPLAEITIELRAASGYWFKSTSTITPGQWERVLAILNEPKKQEIPHE